MHNINLKVGTGQRRRSVHDYENYVAPRKATPGKMVSFTAAIPTSHKKPQMHVDLWGEFIERLDAYDARAESQTPGKRWNRALPSSAAPTQMELTSLPPALEDKIDLGKDVTTVIFHIFRKAPQVFLMLSSALFAASLAYISYSAFLFASVGTIALIKVLIGIIFFVAGTAALSIWLPLRGKR